MIAPAFNLLVGLKCRDYLRISISVADIVMNKAIADFRIGGVLLNVNVLGGNIFEGAADDLIRPPRKPEKC